MSVKNQILDWFRKNPDTPIDNAGLRDRLGLGEDDAQQVSVALNALANEYPIKREKKEDGGRGLTYWLPKAAAADIPEKPGPLVLDAKETTERLLKARGAKKPKTRRVKKAKKSRVDKKAAQKAERLARAGKAAKSRFTKRKYRKQAPPQAHAAPAALLAPADPSDAVFAISSIGQLGIDTTAGKVALDRRDIQRLQAFMQTVAPLWQPAA